jgi:hypothetical protein
MTRKQATEELMSTLDNLRIRYDTDIYLIQPDTAAILVDIAIPAMALAIDVNEAVDVSVDTCRDLTRIRAQERVLIAHKAGYGLVQMLVEDFECTNLWPYLKKRLEAHARGRQTIGARECKVRQMRPRERNEFLATWHAQGPISRAGTSVALTHDGQVLACMCLGKSRYADDGVEMLRYCTRPDIAVAGGFDKLLAHARRLVGDDVPIVSYADLNCSMRPRTIYDEQFECLGPTPPGYRWINPTTGDVRSRYQCMKHRLVAEGADSALTERQTMHSRGYIRVYGAGSMKYRLN